MWKNKLKQAINNNGKKQFTDQAAFSVDAEKMFASVCTETIAKQIDKNDPNDPVLKQFLPHQDELIHHPEFNSDPVADGSTTQLPGLIHKYKNRVLLIASGSCAVNCRYCFRRHFPYSQNFAPRNNWQAAIDYLTQHKEINEVILSGGDPLTLSTHVLKNLSDQLQGITHIDTLRIHSRIPVVLPERIDAEFADWIKGNPLRTIMVLHINHPNELGREAQKAIGKLHKLKVTLFNQSVILRGINDQATILKQLSHELFALHIHPYYLNVMDKVQNASHFDVPIAEAQSIHQQLKSMLPGYLVPKLVCDLQSKESKTWL